MVHKNANNIKKNGDSTTKQPSVAHRGVRNQSKTSNLDLPYDRLDTIIPPPSREIYHLSKQVDDTIASLSLGNNPFGILVDEKDYEQNPLGPLINELMETETKLKNPADLSIVNPDIPSQTNQTTSIPTPSTETPTTNLITELTIIADDFEKEYAEITSIIDLTNESGITNETNNTPHGIDDDSIQLTSNQAYFIKSTVKTKLQQIERMITNNIAMAIQKINLVSSE